MNISGAQGQKPISSAKNQDNNDSQKLSLEQKKLSLMDEMKRVKEDKNLSKEAAQKKEAELRDQIKMIDDKIRELNSKNKQVDKTLPKEEETKVKESNLSMPTDIYEKGDEEDKGDLVYQVKNEDGKMVIQYKKHKSAFEKFEEE